eukprot:TRINITY_DN5311_c0_g1_i2.p1 TRINITY_DN5311_c0_g1~~TRINITY_DN5311_c0_g1_i2.p1  ORF type:complete len:524 (-),score=77.91 TRINITY_DN5311_c0_g1_i2:344-1750(-)
MVAALLRAKPDNPHQWLLAKLEADILETTDHLSESDLHKLFAATRRISSEIAPRDTIDMVISETLGILGCAEVSLFVLERKSGMLLVYSSDSNAPSRMHVGQGIASTVFNTQKTMNIRDCGSDSRFSQSFERRWGRATENLIAMPILDYEGNSVGVIQAVNKHVEKESDAFANASFDAGTSKTIPFGRRDEMVLQHLTQHIAIAIRNAEVYREAIMTSDRSTGLLNSIQSVSQDLGGQSLLLTITMHANKIVSAQRSTVFLVDEQHQQLWSVSTDTGQEIRIPKHAGIAGQCCSEGIIINIPDAYSDRRFNQSVDKKTGFKTHSILAVPLFCDGDDLPECSTPHKRSSAELPKGRTGKQVIGVIQMINKVSYDGQLEAFDEGDIDVMEMFSKFVGPSLRTSGMLSKRSGEELGAMSEAELGLHAGSDSLRGAELLRQCSKKRASDQPIRPTMEIFDEEEEDDDGNQRQ